MTKTVDAARLRAPALDAISFRDAMAQVASAVHVVTTDGVAGRAGLTATAVASVSDQPPTVLACIEAGSRTLAAIRANGVFCLNTLPGDTAELAEVFAGRRGVEGQARFGTAAWGELVTGAPALDLAIAAFDCRLVAIHEAASHRIIVGEVVALGGDAAVAQGTGLIYRRRRFERV
jgi:flavin reductase (DIM6/NTAB) family NADH-FMN oxidoreductase RutF